MDRLLCMIRGRSILLCTYVAPADSPHRTSCLVKTGCRWDGHFLPVLPPLPFEVSWIKTPVESLRWRVSCLLWSGCQWDSHFPLITSVWRQHRGTPPRLTHHTEGHPVFWGLGATVIRQSAHQPDQSLTTPQPSCITIYLHIGFFEPLTSRRLKLRLCILWNTWRGWEEAEKERIYCGKYLIIITFNEHHHCTLTWVLKLFCSLYPKNRTAHKNIWLI